MDDEQFTMGSIEDWDLQAVVRSSSPSLFAPSNWSFNQDYYGRSCSTRTGFLDLQDSSSSACYFKPSCVDATVLLQQQRPLPPTSIVTNNTSLLSVQEQFKEPPKQQITKPISVSSTSAKTDDAPREVLKTKKSKRNQQKRMVQEVTEDGLSSDVWAWRKYGQKPIKGSPYPRSYYRCSSLKGCLARKQVERSNSNPLMFIVTYTADHNHPHPTRRNSLAGTTRSKSSMPKSVDIDRPTKNVDNSSPNLDSVHSTTTVNIQSNIEDAGFVQISHDQTIKTEEDSSGSGSTNEFEMRGIVFSDELFPSLEDFEGLLYMDQFHSTVYD